jgi:hypothetical protein
VTAALDLDEIESAVLIDEEQITCPPASVSCFGRDACFASNEQPPTRRGAVELVTGDEVRIISKEGP